MPNEDVEHIVVDSSQDTPIVVSLTDEQLSEVLASIPENNNPAVVNLSESSLDALRSEVGGDTIALDQSQYDDLMVLVTANTVTMVLVCALILFLIGQKLIDVLVSWWR